MKHYILVVLLSLLASTAQAQTATRITHLWQHAPLSEVLHTISREATDYRIHYIHEQLDSIYVNAKAQQMTVPDAIAKVTKGQPVKVKQKGQDIFVQYNKRMKAKKVILSGIVFDRLTHSQLIGATVVLMNRDSTVIDRGIARSTYQEGKRKWEKALYTMEVPKVDERYIIAVSYIGYETTYMDYELKNIRKGEIVRELPPIYMKQESHVLKNVDVVASKVMFYHRGDTVVYNADAFQLAEGSMLDALIRQLPGAELKDGQIFLNGRFVERLLLNGKDFFRGNQELMLENLPSYTVKEIKAYEKYGDMSTFLGRKMEDDKAYVMDVQLKKQYRIGGLANLEAGGGTKSRYLGRLFALRYSDHSRIGLYANMNNLNDNRKPGEDDGWKPSNMKKGLQSEKQVGLDFNVEERDQKWKADGNVQLRYTDLDIVTNTECTNFLQTGDSHDRSLNSLRDKTWELSTDDKFYADLGSFNLELNPVITYRNYDSRSAFQSTTTAWNDTLLNQRLQQGMTKGYDFKSNYELRSVVKLTPGQDLRLKANARYDMKDDDRFARFDYRYGNSGAVREYGDQMFRNHPSYSSTLYGDAAYVRQLNTDMQLYMEYSYLYYERHQKQALYQLDLIDSLGTNPFGYTPTDIEFAQTFDAQNSYDYRTYDNRHALKPVLFWFPNIGGSKASIGIFARGTWYSQQMHYQRGVLDTTFVRRTVYFESPYNYFQWGSKDGKYQIWFQYNLTVAPPSLTNFVNIYDATDPMNVYVGNSDLKNLNFHYIHTNLQKRDKERQIMQSLNFRWEYNKNKLIQGYIYNPETGVRIWRPYTVNGNWYIGGTYSLTLPLDKKRRLMLRTITHPTYAHNVSMIGTSTLASATPDRYSIRNLSLEESLQLTCKLGDHRLTLKGQTTLRNVTSPMEGFTRFTAQDYTYGALALIQLPLKMQLSTDLTAYTRKGYTSPEMNGTDIVWNARLTYPLMKGQMTVMLDAFDILGQLSNVTRALNAQSRTESYTNTLPRYALLHVTYRLNKMPRRPKDQQ